jgi:hypothetical protein
MRVFSSEIDEREWVEKNKNVDKVRGCGGIVQKPEGTNNFYLRRLMRDY